MSLYASQLTLSNIDIEAGEECNDTGPGACTEVDMSPKQKSSSSGLALDTDTPGTHLHAS